MSVNRGLLITGIVLALVGAGAVFVLNFLFAPPTDFVMAAREDLPAGTVLSQVPEDSFVQIPLQFSNRSARKVLDGMVQPAQLAAMRKAGAVLIQDVYKYQPLVVGGIVSADNPAAQRVVRLGMDKPDLMVVTIPGSSNIPEGVRVGDRVDLAVAVPKVAEPLNLAQATPAGGAVSLPGTSLAGVPPEALAALLEQAGYQVVPPSGTKTALEPPTPMPSPTPSGPSLREPVTKVLVRGAQVVNVRHEKSLAGVSQQGQPTVVTGAITGLDVVIPRQAFEFVTMAINSGNLQVGLLSPLVAGMSEGPTLGASLQDLLDLYMRDRESLAPAGTPAAP
jgi:hypothetical protein